MSLIEGVVLLKIHISEYSKTQRDNFIKANQINDFGIKIINVYEYKFTDEIAGFFVNSDVDFRHYRCESDSILKNTSTCAMFNPKWMIEKIMRNTSIDKYLTITEKIPVSTHQYSSKHNQHTFNCVMAVIHPVENTNPIDYYIMSNNTRIDIKHEKLTEFGPYYYRAYVNNEIVGFENSLKKIIMCLFNKKDISNEPDDYMQEQIINILKRLNG